MHQQPFNAGDIEEDPNTVYIDRNSKDVEVSINDDSNYKLDHIEITYFDLESQTFKDLSHHINNILHQQPFYHYNHMLLTLLL